MSNQFLSLPQLLSGAALFKPATAAQSLAGSSDFLQVNAAFESLALVIPEEADSQFAASFQDRYVRFQEAAKVETDPNHPDTFAIVRNDLAPLIGSLPETTWQRIARRFGFVSEEFVENNTPWTRSVIVEGDHPILVEKFRAQIPQLIDKLVGVSVIHRERGSISYVLFEYGLLESDHLKFRVSSLSSTDKYALTVEGTQDEKGIPLIDIKHQPDCPLDEAVLVYGIVDSFKKSLPPYAKLTGSKITKITKTQLLRPEVRRAELKNHAISFEKMRGDLSGLSHFRVARSVQKELLHGKSEKIQTALNMMNLLPEIRERLKSLTKALQFRLSLKTNKIGPNPRPALHVEFRPAKPNFLPGDLRRKETLFVQVDLPLSEEDLQRITSDHLWGALAQALVLWSAEVRSSKEDSWPLILKGIHPQTDIPTNLFYGYGISLPLNQDLPDGRGQEYPALRQWISSLKGKGEGYLFPGLSELKKTLEEGDLDSIWGFSSPLKQLRWEERTDETAIETITFNPVGPSQELCWEGVVHSSRGKFFSRNPIEWMEIAMRGLESALRPGPKDSRPSQYRIVDWGPKRPIPVEEILERNGERTYEWSWLRLMWAYERLLATSRDPDFVPYFGGHKGEAIREKLSHALHYFLPIDSEKVEESLLNQPFWLVDYTEIDILTSVEDASSKLVARIKGAKPATFVSVITTSTAKLIHFDGKPNFDVEEWRFIAKVILYSPEGLTFFDPKHGWKTNRPELLAEEQEEAWYQLNPRYCEVTPGEKAIYRGALNQIRLYAEEEKMRVPDPTTPLSEIKKIFRALSIVHHPDKKGTGAQDIGNVFGKINEAFKVLERFHQEEASK